MEPYVSQSALQRVRADQGGRQRPQVADVELHLVAIVAAHHLVPVRGGSERARERRTMRRALISGCSLGGSSYLCHAAGSDVSTDLAPLPNPINVSSTVHFSLPHHILGLRTCKLLLQQLTHPEKQIRVMCRVMGAIQQVDPQRLTHSLLLHKTNVALDLKRKHFTNIWFICRIKSLLLTC